MVEPQSCASLVNASALCSREHEVKGEGTVNLIAQMSAELQREREKNAQLMERISVLEAQIQERDKKSFIVHGPGSCLNAIDGSHKKFKRQKIGAIHNGTEERNVAIGEIVTEVKHDSQCSPPKKYAKVEDRLVNWISMDETQFLHNDKLKDNELDADFNDADDSDEEDDCKEVDTHIDIKIGKTYEIANQLNAHYQHQNGVDEGINIPSLGSFFAGQCEPTFPLSKQEKVTGRKKNSTQPDAEQANKKKDILKQDGTETDIGVHKAPADDSVSKETCNRGHGNISSVRKPPKVAFCPKEVKRILDSDILLLKNAQSHTIRKIIVFASLGIRHGCDDMYELDFNHFSIVSKGEPYMSATDPGEHVLYENPGVRRKIFFPNRQHPTLCPVQILEEEKSMRPSDPSCPSCLFLCIKYGGRTRNLPQNEYVRQRMGRNKLKSFGPVMCGMARLVHIRCGSFFFKALGITLLFMAGIPDDLVQGETKYRNLYLLQKYYRTDEDAEGEELFLPHPMTYDTSSLVSQKLTGNTISSRLKGKKQATTVSPTQLGLMGYTSIQTQAIESFQSKPSHTLPDILQIPNQEMNSSNINVSSHNQTPYHMIPPHPPNAFMPMLYWSTPNAFPPNTFASTYGYQPFPSTANYISIHPQGYYGHPSYTYLVPKMAERNWKNDATLVEADSNSDSSSSSTEPKEAIASCK